MSSATLYWSLVYYKVWYDGFVGLSCFFGNSSFEPAIFLQPDQKKKAKVIDKSNDSFCVDYKKRENVFDRWICSDVWSHIFKRKSHTPCIHTSIYFPCVVIVVVHLLHIHLYLCHHDCNLGNGQVVTSNYICRFFFFLPLLIITIVLSL